MKNHLRKKTLILLLAFLTVSATAQNYSFNDFVGTWHGTISATNYGGFNDPITMTIYEDGFYTETSGHLMPTLYPNTQQCEYEASTNRFHWWYLDLVYAGQHFYAHHFYEIVYFENDSLVMHYNYWDNPEPWPDAGVIILVKENTNTTPPPVNLDLSFESDVIYLTWDEPEAGGASASLIGFNVYVSLDMENYDLLGYTEDMLYPISEMAAAGVNSYYVTAIYDEGESLPSDILLITFDTPEPETLAGEALPGSIALEWSAPEAQGMPVASLLGYDVYHKFENGSYEFVQFVEETNFMHENPLEGTHYYYVVAVYIGGESDPSSEIEVSYILASLTQNVSEMVRIYPNPAADFVTIQTGQGNQTIQLFGPNGKLVLVETIQNSKRFDLTGYSAGVYHLVISSAQGKTTKKLVVR